MAKQNVNDFCEHAKYCALNRSSFYDGSFPNNSMRIHNGGVLSADCIGFIKGLINDPDIWKKTSPVGYYAPIGKNIGDIGEREIWNQCSGRSTDFTKLVKGSYIEMDSRVGHAGLYVGDFTDPSGVCNVIECTVNFGGGITTSYVDSQGRRWNHKNGTLNDLRWERHGKLSKWIDYGTAPKPTPSGKLDVDGEWGYATTYALQRFFKTEQDGEVSNQDLDCKRYCLNCVPLSENAGSWVWNNSRGYSPLIVALQNWCGMDRSKQDGKFGYGSIRALQRKLTDCGFKVEEDGYCGPETVKALQNFLNKQS